MNLRCYEENLVEANIPSLWRSFSIATNSRKFPDPRVFTTLYVVELP